MLVCASKVSHEATQSGSTSQEKSSRSWPNKPSCRSKAARSAARPPASASASSTATTTAPNCSASAPTGSSGSRTNRTAPTASGCSAAISPSDGIVDFKLGDVPAPKSPDIADTWARFPVRRGFHPAPRRLQADQGIRRRALRQHPRRRHVALGVTVHQSDAHFLRGERHQGEGRDEDHRHGAGGGERLRRLALRQARPDHDLLRAGRHGHALQPEAAARSATCLSAKAPSTSAS